jgi:hypothetical protein
MVESQFGLGHGPGHMVACCSSGALAKLKRVIHVGWMLNMRMRFLQCFDSTFGIQII